MKVHLTWIGVAALTAAAFNAHNASAQYAPYLPQQQPLPQVNGYPGYPAIAQRVIAPSAPVAAPAAAQATPSRYSTPAVPAVAAAPRYSQTAPQSAAQIPAYSYLQTTYPQTTYPQTAQAPSYPSVSNYTTYSSVAQQPAPPTPPAPTENEQIPAPKSNATEPSAAAPEARSPNGAAPAAVNGNGYGYPTANGHGGYGQSSYGTTDYGIAGACEPQGGGTVWFGGLYWLFMERDNPNTQKLTVRVDHDAATDPYYPPANATVLDTDKTDFDFRSGVELRFGSTFTIGSACDEGCGSGCPPDNYAWEVAWWGLDEDDQHSTYYDRDPLNQVRLYGMINFAGLEYSDGTMGRPVNDFYGYGLPIVAPTVPPLDGDIIVMGQRTRSYFSAQNIEVNIIRFPVCGTGCGGGGCGSTGCGYDDCGYGAYGCEPACNPISFSMCGMCGVRYFRIDDDFYYGSQFAMWDAGAYLPLSWINYDINVDNSLIGPQVGWNMNYCVGCKWNFFCNTSFGVFNNHIESNQRVWGENGTARHTQSGELMSSESDKDDVSFLGELRLGGSYDVTCNWRAVLAYRAVAITGVANSVDQIPTDFTNAEYPGMIDSDSSIVIHGVQAGVECKY